MSEAVSLAFAFAWLMAAPAVQSQDVSPDVLMKGPSGGVIAEVRKDQPIKPLIRQSREKKPQI